MFRPSTRNSPAILTPSIMSFMRLRQRSSVDLPQPDGPMNAVTWFAGRSSEISWIACFSPYQTLAFRISIATGPPAGGGSPNLTSVFRRKPAADGRRFAWSRQHQKRRCLIPPAQAVRTTIAVRLSSTTISSSSTAVAYTIGFAASTFGL